MEHRSSARQKGLPSLPPRITHRVPEALDSSRPEPHQTPEQRQCSGSLRTTAHRGKRGTRRSPENSQFSSILSGPNPSGQTFRQLHPAGWYIAPCAAHERCTTSPRRMLSICTGLRWVVTWVFASLVGGWCWMRVVHGWWCEGDGHGHGQLCCRWCSLQDACGVVAHRNSLLPAVRPGHTSTLHASTRCGLPSLRSVNPAASGRDVAIRPPGGPRRYGPVGATPPCPLAVSAVPTPRNRPACGRRKIPVGGGGLPCAQRSLPHSPPQGRPKIAPTGTAPAAQPCGCTCRQDGARPFAGQGARCRP